MYIPYTKTALLCQKKTSKVPIFIGRDRELSLLSDLLKKKTASLVVMRGRRRIGKSRLLAEFGKNIRTIILSGIPPEDGVTAEEQREAFAEQLARKLNIPKPSSESWTNLFWALSEQTKTGRVLIILDEITWMGSEDSTFLGKLKNAWNMDFKNNNQLILALCGSVSAWIEKNIISSSGFVGRISLTMVLKELALANCDEFWGTKKQQLSAYEKFKYLAISGGVPSYLEQLIPEYSAEENIKRLCFIKEGYLFNEFENIFHDLFGKRSEMYKKIILALLAKPKAELSDIYQLLGSGKQGIISDYLHDLSLAGFISRDYAWNFATGKQAKASTFRISDNYVRFYAKYILPNKNKIENEAFEKRSITSLPAWDTIMGLQFENLVITNKKNLYRLLHIEPADIVAEGPYIQRKSKQGQGCQIDYLIQMRYNSFFIVEIKFSKSALSKQLVEEMKQKLERLQLPKNFSYRMVVIHVNGVTDELIAEDYFSAIIDFSELF